MTSFLVEDINPSDKWSAVKEMNLLTIENKTPFPKGVTAPERVSMPILEFSSTKEQQRVNIRG